MIRINRKNLEKFCSDVFVKLGVPQDEAQDSAEVLVCADARGIASHGIGRLWRYKNGIQKGVMAGGIKPKVMRETPVSLILDAQGALGMSLSKKTMTTIINMAEKTGVAFSSIRNSNHFGIAGYYAEMAARKDMIGICMTNTAALGVPTFACKAMFGTNPIAIAVPAANGTLFSLDMSTTVVTRGKIEVYEREDKPLPLGWAVDTAGKGTTDAHKLLDDMLFQRGGGIMPLGGEGELFSGYKGFGLATWVDIMCAVASGGEFGQTVMDSQATSARVCHFFAAIKIDIFRDCAEFKADMTKMLDEINAAKPAEGCDRVYYAGQKEHEAETQSAKIGVPVSDKVLEQLQKIGEELQITFPAV